MGEGSPAAPRYFIAGKGLNIMGICWNRACRAAYRKNVVHRVGCNKTYDFGRDGSYCPACGEEFEPSFAGFTDCQWRVHFRRVEGSMRSARVTWDWQSVGRDWNPFMLGNEDQKATFT